MQKYWRSPLTFRVTLKAGWQQWLACWPGLSAWWESPRYVLSESFAFFLFQLQTTPQSWTSHQPTEQQIQNWHGHPQQWYHELGGVTAENQSFRPWDVVTWIQGSVLSSWQHHASCCRTVSQHCSCGRAPEWRHRSTASIPPVACLLLAVPYLFI